MQTIKFLGRVVNGIDALILIATNVIGFLAVISFITFGGGIAVGELGLYPIHPNNIPLLSELAQWSGAVAGICAMINSLTK